MTNVVPWLVIAAAVALSVWRRRRRGRAATNRSLGLDRLVGTEVALVAEREIRQRLRGRFFRVATVLMLVGVAAAIVIPVATKGKPSARRVGVVGPLSTAQQALVRDAGKAARTKVELVTEPSRTAANEDLRKGNVDIVTVGAHQVVIKTSLSSDDTSTTATLARAISVTFGEQNAFRAAGLSLAQINGLRGARPAPIIGLARSRPTGSGRGTATIGVILLFILLTQYNTWTLIGVMEEKASRVVEVLLATVRPAQLLAGKVLGIGLLVFGQAGLVVAVALGLAGAVGSDVLHGAGPATVVTTLIWLVLGYAFYSWVYAAAGSLAERQDQVQSLAVPIALPMILGYVMSLTVAGSGRSSPFFDVLAYLPPTAPFAMPVLVGLNDVTWWQVVISALISLAGTFAVARAAAAVYRRAVLRTGRRVKLRELMR